MVRQDKSKPGRVTPKGTVPQSDASSRSGSFDQSDTMDNVGASGVSRQPVNIDKGSPLIVPIVMFGALGAGTLLILFNYMVKEDPSNWLLLGGLGLVLIGIIAATQFK